MPTPGGGARSRPRVRGRHCPDPGGGTTPTPGGGTPTPDPGGGLRCPTRRRDARSRAGDCPDPRWWAAGARTPPVGHQCPRAATLAAADASAGGAAGPGAAHARDPPAAPRRWPCCSRGHLAQPAAGRAVGDPRARHPRHHRDPAGHAARARASDSAGRSVRWPPTARVTRAVNPGESVRVEVTWPPAAPGGRRDLLPLLRHGQAGRESGWSTQPPNHGVPRPTSRTPPPTRASGRPPASSRWRATARGPGPRRAPTG